jgi:5-methylcytosine-specific restriction endonuclease McrA
MQPVSRHGTDLEENLWIICRACNRAKGNLTLYEFRVKGV